MQAKGGETDSRSPLNPSIPLTCVTPLGEPPNEANTAISEANIEEGNSCFNLISFKVQKKFQGVMPGAFILILRLI